MQENLDLGVTSVGITLGTTGTDVSVTGSPITTSGNITINLPTASATNRGLLSSADWTTFNNKQAAGNYVTLDTAQTITAQKTFTTSGSSDTMIISHGSGSGFALDVIKAGNGEAIRVQKTSGSGNAMTISGGNFEAGTIVKTGGTSSQFLKADGSVDSSTYLTTGTAASTYVPYTGATGAVNLGTHSLSANNLTANGGTNAGRLELKNADNASLIRAGYFVLSPSSSNTIIQFGFGTGASTWKNFGFSSHLIPDNTITLFSLPSGGGTLAVTTDLGAYLPLAGGTLTGTLEIGTSAPSIFMRGANSGVKSIQFANAGGSLHWTLQTSFGASGEQQPFSIRNAVLGQDAILIQPASNNISLTGALNGTSASFTGALNGTSAIFTGSVASVVPTGNTALITLKSGNGESYISEVDGNLNMLFVNKSTLNIGPNFSDIRFCTNNNTTTPALILDVTGAATFSSSVTAGNNFVAKGSLQGYSGAGIFMSYESYGGRLESYDYSTSTWKNIGIAPNGGNVGIGTNSPSYRTQISAPKNTTSLFVTTDNISSAGDYSEIGFGNLGNGSSVFSAIRSAFDNPAANANTSMQFFTNGASYTERMRITSDGFARLSASSGGIQFNGDTAAANALDDYEEGTFTLSFEGSTTPGTYTSSSVTAKYTKIGRSVTIQYNCNFSSASGGSGNIIISGLPFNYSVNSGGMTAVLTSFSLGWSGSYLTLLPVTSASSNSLVIIENEPSGGYNFVQAGDFNTSTDFRFTLTYFV
jgi:hypothetical protein